MAKSCPLLLAILIISTFSIAKSLQFPQVLSLPKLGLKKEKLSHLHFYSNSTVTGPNATDVTVAYAATSGMSDTGYGSVYMMDDPLILTPQPGAKVVGRAQGLYASASQSEFCYFVTFNFVFNEGKYNGSTLTLLGRYRSYSLVREMSIIHGSGIFRFARGYAEAKTRGPIVRDGGSLEEYNVYVLHY